MHTILFDIDGTLVKSYDFDSSLYVRAVQETLGDLEIRRDWSSYVHVTDTGILDEILRENGFDDTPTHVPRVRQRFQRLIEDHLGRQPCAPVRGALATVERLLGDPAWNVGLATGGWRSTATAKLRSAGFDPEQLVLCTSDDHHQRREIMDLCRQTVGGTHDRTVYVGDGTWDLRATRELGWGFVAVGERLEGAHPHWVRDFEDPDWPAVLSRALAGTAS